MPLTELNHYFVRANDLEKTKDFYCDVLGFEVMPRPNFPFPGYWLGINGKIQVHMGPAGIRNQDMYYLGTPKNAATDNSGVVDHIAFLANEPEKFVKKFKEMGMSYRPRSLPESELFQLFIKDPNGLTIELNFFGIKQAPNWGGENYAEMESSEVNAPSKAEGFAGVSYQEAIARARTLIPILRERAPKGEAARVMPDGTTADLHRTGLLRTMQPKRWGGMELDFVAYVDFPFELARGCASTGWNAANLLIHHWMLALYDERAQEEVWGSDPDALIASGIAFPQGSAKKVDGGFVLSGRWNFSSCVDVAGWNMLACIVRDGQKVIDHRMCLVPKSDYEIVDDWHVLGMRSTGSMTVVAKDVFVPEYRALCAYDARGGDKFPGARGNPNPVYRVPLSTLGGHGIGGVAVGNAQAALDLTIQAVEERSTSYVGLRMRDIQTVQLRVGAAGARIDAALRILRQDCLEGREIAERNVIADSERKLRFKRNLAFAVGLCTEAVDMLHSMAGANGIYDAYPIQRIFRDAHSLAGHISFNTDAQYSTWGLAALGGDIVSPTL